MSLLAHLAVFCALDTTGMLQTHRLGAKESSFNVVLISSVMESAKPTAVSAFHEEARQDAVVQPSTGGYPFVSPDDLTHRPVLLDNVELPLQDGLWLSGKVTLRLYIRSDGVVERIELAESHLPPAYGAFAMQAFLKRRFSPGRIGSKAVPTFTELEIEFNPPE